MNRNSGRAQTIVTIILVVVIGGLFGVGGGILLHDVTDRTHTSPSQMLSPPFEGRKQFYILTLGEDNIFSKNKDVHGRSDTILVAAVDVEKNTIRAVSIPRDTRCIIAGRSNFDKINAAHAYGGPDLSRRTAELLLGVPIQYYVKTNIDGLKRTVDILGGVEIDIEKNMRYRDRRGGLYINLKKGHRHLDGDKALQYVRFRHDAMGDISRIQRQQKFLRAIARRMLATENVGKLPTVIDEIMSNIETNMSGKDLLSLARLSKKIQPDEVEMETLPGVPETIGGISYWIPNEAQSQLVVDRLLKFRDPAAAAKPSVEVLNGAGEVGAAAKVSEFLIKSGYQVMSTGNAASFDHDQTEIQTRAADVEHARQLGSLLKCTRIVELPEQSATAAQVTVIVGRDMRF